MLFPVPEPLRLPVPLSLPGGLSSYFLIGLPSYLSGLNSNYYFLREAFYDPPNLSDTIPSPLALSQNPVYPQVTLFVIPAIALFPPFPCKCPEG